MGLGGAGFLAPMFFGGSGRFGGALLKPPKVAEADGLGAPLGWGGGALLGAVPVLVDWMVVVRLLLAGKV